MITHHRTSSMMTACALCAAIALVALFPRNAHGSHDTLLQQGVIVDNASGKPLSGVREMTFRIYPSATAAAPLWEETQDVEFTQGYYGATLGQIEPFPLGLFSQHELFIGVQVEGDEQEMKPRQQLFSVPYAQRALVADIAKSLDANVVHTDNIAPGAVTASQIAAGAVGNSQLATGAVTSSQIATGAIGTTQMAPASVTSLIIADGAVGATQIASGAVGSAQLAPESVGPVQLQDTSVTAGSYSLATITVDADGRITAASSGSAGTGSVTSVASGSGLQGGPITTAGTLALGDLTADWNQTGAFDIILNNADSQLKMLESIGGTFYGTIDVGDLNANRTYTFPDATGTVALTTSNISGNAATATALATTPSVCAAGSYARGVDASGNAVHCTTAAIGTVTGVGSGNGLTGGPITTSGTLSIDATTSGVTSTTNTNSGLEVASDGVRLLGGCANDEILKWNSGAETWSCAPDASGSGTVTSVATGAGLTGGPITTTGTISIADGGVGPTQLADTTVTPGSYTLANITVDADGRITAAASGSAGTGSVTSVASGNGLSGGPITTAGTLALGDLTADWNQTGAFDIVLNDVDSELLMLDASGLFFGTLDVDALTAARTYVLPDEDGTVCTTGSVCSGYQSSSTALNTSTSWSGDLTGSGSSPSIANNAVTSAKIADGAITDADINASAAIAFSKLAALTSGHLLVGNASNIATSVTVSGDATLSSAGALTIASGAITSGKIAADAVGPTQLAPTSVTPGSYTNTNLTVDADGRITAASNGTSTSGTVTSVATGTGLTGGPITASGTISIANLGVDTAQLAASAVTSVKIADAAIVTEKINDGAITSAKIANAAVTMSAIANNAVATANIADNAVSNAKIADGAITTSKINNNAVTGAKISLASEAVGDMMYYDGTDWVRLAAGSSGQVLQANGAAAPSWETPAASVPSLTANWIQQEEWTTRTVTAGTGADLGNIGELNWTLTATGTGSAIAKVDVGAATADQGRFGVIQLTGGPAAKRGICLNLDPTSIAGVPSNMTVEFDWAAVTDLLQQTVRIGLLDTTTSTAPTDGIYFQYNVTTSSGNWFRCTMNNGTSTCTNTGIAIATAGTYQRFKFVTNNDGTQVDFFIDGASAGSNATNLPSSTASYGPGICAHTANATARSWKTDYFQLTRTGVMR